MILYVIYRDRKKQVLPEINLKEAANQKLADAVIEIGPVTELPAAEETAIVSAPKDAAVVGKPAEV